MLSDTVFENLLLADVLTIMDVACFGGNNGEATVITTGGSTPYTYEWSNMQTGNTATGLTAGIYTITVTDLNGCESTDEVVIEEPTEIIAMASNIVNVNCFGGNNGAVTMTATGGIPPYNFVWLTGQNGTSITMLEAGIYSVTITDINLCDVNETVTITEPAQMDTTVTVSGITLTANITGTATFQWFNCGGSDIPQATGISYTPTANGAYAVRITSDGCTDESSCFEISTVGIQNNASTSSNLTVYPNPNNGRFYITADKAGDYNLMNGLGQLVQKIQLNHDNNFKTEVNEMAVGVYYLIGYEGNQTVHKKVVVTK
ncbi:MAG: T9SS type A sorting domain-containing protein [Bacteroidetes bacterium]|nr:T9SS type A sorting domain-containing protein [Bacteroidota bacterium]